jgi:TonB-dependent SusC/RagA subfamily outer membrane receptor
MKIAVPAKFALIIMLFTCTQLFGQSKPITILPGSYNNIYDLLREIPGLEVKSSTDKSGGTVVIRGIGSLTNQRNPLIVVDGVIYNGDLSSINPKDVDGIDVLKDASSAAAFGARGAFGVIVITLKKGAVIATQPKVSEYDASAFAYFIDHATQIRVFGLKDQVLVEGVIKEQRKNQLVFVKKRKETLINLSDISRIEMIPE